VHSIVEDSRITFLPNVPANQNDNGIKALVLVLVNLFATM
jgi:hypothetical protein